jgi:hypothetical protein
VCGGSGCWCWGRGVVANVSVHLASSQELCTYAHLHLHKTHRFELATR